MPLLPHLSKVSSPNLDNTIAKSFLYSSPATSAKSEKPEDSHGDSHLKESTLASSVQYDNIKEDILKDIPLSKSSTSFHRENSVCSPLNRLDSYVICRSPVLPVVKQGSPENQTTGEFFRSLLKASTETYTVDTSIESTSSSMCSSSSIEVLNDVPRSKSCDIPQDWNKKDSTKICESFKNDETAQRTDIDGNFDAKYWKMLFERTQQELECNNQYIESILVLMDDMNSVTENLMTQNSHLREEVFYQKRLRQRSVYRSQTQRSRVPSSSSMITSSEVGYAETVDCDLTNSREQSPVFDPMFTSPVIGRNIDNAHKLRICHQSPNVSSNKLLNGQKANRDCLSMDRNQCSPSPSPDCQLISYDYYVPTHQTTKELEQTSKHDRFLQNETNNDHGTLEDKETSSPNEILDLASAAYDQEESISGQSNFSKFDPQISQSWSNVSSTGAYKAQNDHTRINFARRSVSHPLLCEETEESHKCGCNIEHLPLMHTENKRASQFERTMVESISCHQLFSDAESGSKRDDSQMIYRNENDSLNNYNFTISKKQSKHENGRTVQESLSRYRLEGELSPVKNSKGRCRESLLRTKSAHESPVHTRPVISGHSTPFPVEGSCTTESSIHREGSVVESKKLKKIKKNDLPKPILSKSTSAICDRPKTPFRRRNYDNQKSPDCDAQM